jgi:hypothetical protein
MAKIQEYKVPYKKSKGYYTKPLQYFLDKAGIKERSFYNSKTKFMRGEPISLGSMQRLKILHKTAVIEVDNFLKACELSKKSENLPDYQEEVACSCEAIASRHRIESSPLKGINNSRSRPNDKKTA